MISGRQALGSIDQTLTQAHTQIDNVEGQIRDATNLLVAEQKTRLQVLRELAAVRLDRLDDEQLGLQLDHADRQAVALLAQRDEALVGLAKSIRDAERQREQHDAERKHQAAQLDGAIGVVDQAEARIQQRLDHDSDYRVQREQAEQAERRAMHASEKAGRSQEELGEKGAAYKRDRLFMYLWEREYAQPGYQSGGLIRWLDDKVARLIGYADARVNYARLNEIPRRLREHADHLTGLADEEFVKLKALDEAARIDEGIPALEKRVADEQRVLDQIDAHIEAAEANYQDLLHDRAAFASGDDPHTRQAIAYLAAEFQRTEVSELRSEAYQTPYPEDDLVVSRLLEHESEQRRLEHTVADLRGLLEKHRARLHELETLRGEFKRKRYDRAGSVFTSDSIIPVLLGQFVAGLLDSNMLWKVLKEHQRYSPRQSDPRFGSGGFGRGSVWSGGLGDLGDIVGKIGRGGFGGRGGGGGGFRTGGGF